MIRTFFISLLLAVSLPAQGWPQAPDVTSFQAAQKATPQDSDYQEGLRELDQSHWDRAIARFQRAEQRRTVRDAAMYWKAYAENRAGRRADALATVAALRAQFPSSQWIQDAEALKVEMLAQSASAPDPAMQSDEDLKLLAVNSLMQSDPKQAVPILQKVLNGNSSEKVKERALFVLTQSGSPDARAILDQTAKDSAHPELQRKAIQYMGLMGNADARAELASIYKSTSDERLKRDILHSFMQSGSRDFLYDIAKSEQNPKLRQDAIHQLALTGGQDQLRQLYNSETSVENKKAILSALFLTGDPAWLEQVARSEKDPELRIAAIKSLGLMGGRAAPSDVLVNIYRSDANPDVRRAVLNALFLQQNGKALVDLARAEKDPKWKQEIVQKMALVHSKDVTDYMMEVLK